MPRVKPTGLDVSGRRNLPLHRQIMGELETETGGEEIFQEGGGKEILAEALATEVTAEEGGEVHDP